MVAVAFQSVFHAEIHQNNIFFIFLKLFLRSAHQNDPKHIKKLIFSQKKNFFENIICTTFPNTLVKVTNLIPKIKGKKLYSFSLDLVIRINSI